MKLIKAFRMLYSHLRGLASMPVDTDSLDAETLREASEAIVKVEKALFGTIIKLLIIIALIGDTIILMIR